MSITAPPKPRSAPLSEEPADREALEALIGRVVDVILAFPFLVLVIAIVAMLGPGLINLYIALTIVSWALYTRIVRAEVLALKKREYVLAARNLGFGHARILAEHT